jgi:predicted transcriptional regulator
MKEQIRRLFLDDELQELKEVLLKEKFFEEHYPNFSRWLEKAIEECSTKGKGNRIAFGILISVFTDDGQSIPKIIGGCILKKTQGDSVEMKSLFRSNEEDDSKCYGKKLLKQVEDHSIKRGYTRVVTDCPCNLEDEKKDTLMFLVQRGFQIDGRSELYKMGDYSYVLSKELIPYYSGDPFDWLNLSKWFLKNVYNVSCENENKEDEFIKIPFNWNIRSDIRPDKNQDDVRKILARGVALISERDIAEEKITTFITDTQSKQAQVPIIFIKKTTHASSIKSSNSILIDEDNISKLTTYKPYGFSKEEIEGLIVQIKPSFFSEIKPTWKEFVYFKGGPTGKYISKDKKIFFYVDPTPEFPTGYLGGEATVVQCDEGDPSEQWNKYYKKQKIFKNEDHYTTFTENKKSIVTIIAKHFKKFNSPLTTIELQQILGKEYIDYDDFGGHYLNAKSVIDIHTKVDDLAHKKKQTPIKDSGKEKNAIEKTIQHLLKFKQETEKNTKQSFWDERKHKLKPGPEEIGRCNLDHHIKGKYTKSVIHLESRAGKGKSDLFTIFVDGKCQLSETKMWYYDKYVLQEGIKKFDGYMEAEQQKIGYYIVFDHRKKIKLPQTLQRKRLSGYKDVYQIKRPGGKEIYLIHIKIAI